MLAAGLSMLRHFFIIFIAIFITTPVIQVGLSLCAPMRNRGRRTSSHLPRVTEPCKLCQTRVRGTCNGSHVLGTVT